MGPFITQATIARAGGYIPPAFKAKILAATPLAGAGETVEVTFTAPATPGSYPYVCTFPAHYAGGMKGTLVVKAAAKK
jgi:plastocyanin